MLLDLLFPRSCLGCHTELQRGALCTPCEGILLPVETQRCPHCERRIGINGELANECRRELRIHRFFSGNTYANPVMRAAIDGLKFSGIRDAAPHIASAMAYALEVGVAGVALIDISLMPIPLHPARLRERGFNQSELLATHLASALRLPLLKKTLVRKKKTSQQAKLDSKARVANMRDAFAIVRPIKYKRIILVDDVATTGSTLKEAARALRHAGVREVWGIVAARS